MCFRFRTISKLFLAGYTCGCHLRYKVHCIAVPSTHLGQKKIICPTRFRYFLYKITIYFWRNHFSMKFYDTFTTINNTKPGCCLMHIFSIYRQWTENQC